MRAVTAGEDAVLNSTEYAAFYRVSIKDAGGVWRDFSNLSAKNWQIDVSIEENIDQPIAAATVTLFRGEDAANSLSPLMTLSAFA